MPVLVRLPKLIQLAEAQNAPELEAAKTVVAEVHKRDCNSSFFFSPGEDRDYPGEPKENVLLCQALQTFFPNSGLQTCVVSFKGRQISKNCCTIDHNINVMDKLTLMVEERDFIEAETRHLTKRKVRGTTTGSKSFKKSRSLQLHQKLLQDQEDSDQERKLVLSSTETDEDMLEKIRDTNEYPHSPTF